MEEKVLLQRGIREFFKPLPLGEKWVAPEPEQKRRKKELNTQDQQLLLLDENMAPSGWGNLTNIKLQEKFLKKRKWSNHRKPAPTYCRKDGDGYVACYGSTALARREQKEISFSCNTFSVEAKYELVRYDDGGYITNTTGTKLKKLLDLLNFSYQ